MPLIDHFHAPVLPLFPWESFHAFWAATIAETLNRILPQRYVAVIHSRLGARVEADVAEWEQTDNGIQPVSGNGDQGGVAVQTYAPPRTALTMPIVFPDDLEVRILDTRDGAQLAAVIELASPGNKDRPETRRLFAAKCAAYLARGLGLISIDIVTSHHFNLHNEFVELLAAGHSFAMPEDVFLYAAAYAPARRDEKSLVDLWLEPLALGQPLPVLPLALRGGGRVPVDLETTYSDARRRSRL
jgi:hypothetical protein